MKTFNLSALTRGWMVGKFDSAVYHKDYELGFRYYKAGDSEKSHRHDLSDEVTVVVFGKVEMNGIEYNEGDVIILEKGEYTDFKCLSERAITVCYRPDGSFPNDKYFLEE